MTPTVEDGGLDELVARDFLVREPRSTIRGEEAYRFKHVLIRDVAYAGLSKSSRALLHHQMAQWLAGRPVADELVEIRAYHLDESAQLDEELEGRVSGRSRVPRRRRRSSRRVAGRSRARRTPSPGDCSSAAVELEPTLERRYLAARAAWRMTDIPTVSVRDVRRQRGGARRRVTRGSKAAR